MISRSCKGPKGALSAVERRQLTCPDPENMVYPQRDRFAQPRISLNAISSHFL